MRLEAEGFAVTEADSGEDALGKLKTARPHFVLADLRMPGINGIELLRRIQERQPGLPVLILTAHGGIPDAVEATQAGAVDFLTKPIDKDELLACLRKHLPELENQNEAGSWADNIITRSADMLAVLEDARRVARTDSSVLISGPSGAGKELLAQAIHLSLIHISEPTRPY